MRSKLEVMVGDGGEKDLNVAVRIQGNFVEYVPMALILLLFNEEQGGGAGRRIGARLTFAVIVVSSSLCIASFAGLVR